MNTISTPLLILTSAGVAAFVSGLIAFVGQWLERRSRRRELLLAKAIELAVERTRFLTELAEKRGRPIDILDNAMLTEVYYQWLLHLLDHDELPSDAPAIRGSSRHNGEDLDHQPTER